MWKKVKKLVVKQIQKRISIFWLVLLVIVIAAAAPRLLSYRFSLPFVDHLDEPNYHLAGLEWRGLYDNEGYYEGAPPGFIVLHVLVQPIIEATSGGDLAAIVSGIRLLSIAANLVALVCIALTARLAAGDAAGWLAGLAWGLAPLVLENGVYALPDPWVYLFTALALWLAALAWVKPEHNKWVVGSTAAALLAVVMKYPALPALIPGFVAGLAVLLRNRRQGMILLGIQAGLVAVFGLWLVFGYGLEFGALSGMSSTIQTSGLSNILNPARVGNNFLHVFIPLNAPAFALLAAAGLAALVYGWRRGLERIHIGVLLMALALVIFIPWLVTTYFYVDTTTIRYVLPGTVAACVLMGMAFGQIIRVLPVRMRIGGSLIIAAALALFVFWPQIQDDARLVQNRRLPDFRVDLRYWFDANLEPGTVLVGEENHKTFNPIWGGIPHRHWVDWIETDNVMENTPEAWRDERGVSYAVINKGQLRNMQASAEGQAYLENLLHLRDFDGVQRGPDMTIFRLWRMEHESDVRFGDAIRLIGYDDEGEIQPGEDLTLRFYWQADQTPADNYSLFIHLTALDDDTPLVQADVPPAAPERLTLTWDAPDETLISPVLTLTIPTDLAPGEYRVRIGLYSYTTGIRLPVGEGDSFDLLHFRVAR